MDSKSIERIKELIQTYNTKDFIVSDPISFPHQYKSKADIEISALISSWIAYGNRKLILKTLALLHEEINKNYQNSPLLFIKERGFQNYQNNHSCLYRFYTYNDYYMLCERLYIIYIEEHYSSLEDKIREIMKELISLKTKDNATDFSFYFDIALQALILCFNNIKGIPKDSKSACKRLAMLLRWLVRNDNIVDFGLWNIISPQDLILPLDTHVHRISLELGLTKSKQANMKTAKEITRNIKEIFPNDPAIADFALFGFGVNQ